MNKPDGQARFDAICPIPGQAPFDYVLAARSAGVTTLFVFLQDKDAKDRLAEESFIPFTPAEWYHPDAGSDENSYLSFSRFFYRDRVWDLTKADELSILLSEFSSEEDFLAAYKEVSIKAIDASAGRIALGFEAVGRLLNPKTRDSSVYRKIMLDLADRIARRNMILGYSLGHVTCDLSPFVLRRLAELRVDLLPASFATSPCKLGQGIKQIILSARAAGFGSYISYSNREPITIPIATLKENP